MAVLPAVLFATYLSALLCDRHPKWWRMVDAGATPFAVSQPIVSMNQMCRR